VVAGLLLIAVTVLSLPSGAPFPGLNALAPCLGAALVIWAGLPGPAEPAAAGRLLEAKPMVAVGLISYSLYLWHWPLLVFAHYYALGEPGPVARTVVVLVAVLLAAASWRWVEQPFRSKRRLATRAQLFGAVAGAGALAGLFAVITVLGHGLPGRLPAEARAFASAEDDHNPARDRCFALTAPEMEAGDVCHIGAADGRRPTLIVWGDSHADAITPVFDHAAREHGWAGIAATHGSCPPLLGVEVHEHEDNGCPPLNAAAIDLIERYDIRRVVLAGRWAGYAEGRLYYAEAPPVRLRRAGAPFIRAREATDNHVLFAAALAETVARLRREGREVFIVLPVPEVDRPVPSTLARSVVLGRPVVFAPTRAAYDQRQAFVRATLDRVARSYGAVEIDPAALLCPASRCRIVAGGHPLYYDGDHLSTHGAALLSPLIAPVFADAPVAESRIARVADRRLPAGPLAR
jgi:hypothetical protein